MVKNDVYETKKKFCKRDRFLALYKMSSSMVDYLIDNIEFNKLILYSMKMMCRLSLFYTQNILNLTLKVDIRISH
jgi:hypothetical protein